MIARITTFGGLNLYVNPLAQNQGELIRAVNVEATPFGGIKKRTGYETFLSTGNGSAVESLLSFSKGDGTSIYLYKAQGGLLYYYDVNAGSADWTIAGNGTISPGAGFGAAVLNDTLVGGDGVGSTRHTSNGTAFTDTSLAPIARRFTEFQSRIHAIGTASDDFYSTIDDGTNWQTSGTSDSSSLPIPGEGKLNAIFKANDRVVLTKNSGIINQFDGYFRADLATRLGPSSPDSIGEVEDFRLYLNRMGIYGYGGGKPELVSNPIQSLIYNDDETGISGTAFNTAPGVCHRFDYLLSVGNVTDDLTNQQITNAIIKYNFQKNQFHTWSFADKPTAWTSYKNELGVQTLLFGDATGQVYKKTNAKTDNGDPIEAVVEGFLHFGAFDVEKEFDWFVIAMNPGNQAHVQVAVTDTFHKNTKKWMDLGDVSSGIGDFRFPSDSRGRLLWYRIIDNSTTSTFSLYGIAVDYKTIEN